MYFQNETKGEFNIELVNSHDWFASWSNPDQTEDKMKLHAGGFKKRVNKIKVLWIK